MSKLSAPWLKWLALVLMVLAMAVYVLTIDESDPCMVGDVIDGQSGPRNPAAPGPAAPMPEADAP